MQRSEKTLKKLMVPVLDIRVFALVYNKLCGYSFDMKKRKLWPNIARDYSVPTKTYKIQRPLQDIKLNCIPLGGLYYLCFAYHTGLTYPELLALLLEKKDYFEGFVEYSNTYLAVFEKARVLRGSAERTCFDFNPINDILSDLIDKETIVLQPLSKGYVWRVNEEESVCQLVHLLSKYLPS